MELSELKKMAEEKKKLFEELKGQANAIAGQVALLNELIKAEELKTQ